MTGFDETFLIATAFLVVCVLAGLLIPGRRASSASRVLEPQLAASEAQLAAARSAARDQHGRKLNRTA